MMTNNNIMGVNRCNLGLGCPDHCQVLDQLYQYTLVVITSNKTHLWGSCTVSRLFLSQDTSFVTETPLHRLSVTPEWTKEGTKVKACPSRVLLCAAEQSSNKAVTADIQ